MEQPSGAIQVPNQSEEFQKAQFDVQVQGQAAAFKIETLFSLRTPRHAEQFNRYCNDQQQTTLYLDAEEYATNHRIPLDELFGSGFDSIDVYDGLILRTSMYDILQKLKDAQLKYPQQRYTYYVLECQTATGVPMVVENDAEIGTCTEENLPPSYDSYCIIP